MKIQRIPLILAILITLQYGAIAEESRVFNEIGIVEGEVFVGNFPHDKHVPANNFYIVFQRMDWPKCLFGVHSDIDGKYRIFLGVGGYRVIGYSHSAIGFVDYLAKNQVREIKVKPRPEDVYFNIELAYPEDVIKDNMELELPELDIPKKSNVPK